MVVVFLVVEVDIVSSAVVDVKAGVVDIVVKSTWLSQFASLYSGCRRVKVVI